MISMINFERLCADNINKCLGNSCLWLAEYNKNVRRFAPLDGKNNDLDIILNTERGAPT